MSPAAETHEASCSCGQLRMTVSGALGGRIAICHCLACQRRTGSPFGEQIRVDAAQVRVEGRATEWVRHADEDGEAYTYRFCPVCGATVYYTYADKPEWVIVPVGAFADPTIGPPIRSIYDHRRHPWVEVPASVRGSGD